MNTRKYPRTMQEAFGPYVDYKLEYKHTDSPMDWQDELILWCVVIAVLTVVLLVLSGVSLSTQQ